MAKDSSRLSLFTTLRLTILGVFSRAVRRGFFRIMLMLFLLFVVLPLIAVNLLANAETGNWVLEKAMAKVFNTEVSDVTWDENQTTVSGPGLSLTGSITYRNITIKRKNPLPASMGTKPYPFCNVAEITLRYDLKRLPQQPIYSIEIPKGAVLYFNVAEGRWVDSDLFLTSSSEETELPSLPQVIIQKLTVRLRADSVLREPETLPPNVAGGPREWYQLDLQDIAFLPSRVAADVFELSGTGSGVPFGSFFVGGTVARDGSRTEFLFAQRGLRLNEDTVSALSVEVRRIFDQFQIEGVAELSVRVVIPRKGPLEFNADVDINDGRLCFVNFPLQVSPATARLHVHNNSVVIESIRGRRDSAQVLVTGEVNQIGEVGETLHVTVEIKDLLVDEKFRLGLLDARQQPGNENPFTGVPYRKEEWSPDLIPPRKSWETDEDWRRRQGYPEWPGRRLSEGGIVYPNLSDVLPFVCRAFTPVGYANFKLETREVWKGGEEDVEIPGKGTTKKRITDRDQKWFVYVRDASACYIGMPELNIQGFPLPIFKGFGVVEGTVRPGQPSTFTVRGYTQEELAHIPEADERGMRPSVFLNAERDKPGQKIGLRATWRDPHDKGEPDLILNVTTDGLDVDEELRQVLPPKIREIVSTYDPRGRADVESAEVRIIPDRDYIDYNFSIKAKGVVARYQFPGASRPAEMTDIEGNLRINNLTGTVEISSVRGRLAGSQLFLDVTYREAEPRPTITFSGGSDEFAVVPLIADMLPPDIAKIYADFEPTGNLLIRVAGKRDVPGEENVTTSEVLFRGGSMRYVKFPYLLTQLSGRVYIKVTDAQVEVILQDHGGVGSTKESQVRVSGQVLVPLTHDQPSIGGVVEPIRPPVRYDLDVSATRLSIDGPLLDALTPVFTEKDPNEKPAVVKFIEDLNVKGTIGIKGRVFSNDKGEQNWNIELALEGCSINYTKFPYLISDLTGSIFIDGSNIQFRQVRGSVEGQGVVTLTEAGYSEKDGWAVAISARSVPFTQNLRAALPDVLIKRFDAAKPVGTFDADVVMQGLGEKITFQASVDLHDSTLDAGLHFEKVNARVDLDGVIDKDVRRINGEMRVDSLFWKGAEFNSVTSAIQFIDSRLTLPNMRGCIYGGTLEGTVTVDDAGYEGAVSVRRADLALLGQAAFPKAGDLQGAVDGEVKFHSKVDGNGQIGQGRIDVAAHDVKSPDPKKNTAKLAKVPLFTNMFATTKNPQEFDEGHIFFWLGQDRITIRELDFVSNSARVETFGGNEENYLMYDTGELRMKLFFTLAPRAPTIPGFQQVMDVLKQILFPLYVTGTLGSPKVEAFSLSESDLDKRREVFPRPPKEN